MENFLSALLESNLSLSVAVLVLLALMTVLSRKYRSKSLYYLWIGILAAFLLPFRPEAVPPAVSIPAPDLTRTVSMVSLAPVLEPPAVGTVADAQQPLTQQAPVSAAQVLFLIWIAGAITFALWHTVKHIRFMRQVRRWSTDEWDAHALQAYAGCKAQLGISKDIPLKRCSFITSPMLAGFRAAVYLPTNLEAGGLQHILYHELVHYKRHDLFARVLMLAARSVNWFNPLVHIAARQAGLLCEISCDEAVLQNTGRSDRQAYGQAILSTMATKQTLLTSDFNIGFRGAKERVIALMDMGRRKIRPVLLCAIVCGLVCTALLIGCGQDAMAPDAGADMATGQAETIEIDPADLTDPASLVGKPSGQVTPITDTSGTETTGVVVPQSVEEQPYAAYANYVLHVDGSGEFHYYTWIEGNKYAEVGEVTDGSGKALDPITSDSFLLLTDAGFSETYNAVVGHPGKLAFDTSNPTVAAFAERVYAMIGSQHPSGGYRLTPGNEVSGTTDGSEYYGTYDPASDWAVLDVRAMTIADFEAEFRDAIEDGMYLPSNDIFQDFGDAVEYSRAEYDVEAGNNIMRLQMGTSRADNETDTLNLVGELSWHIPDPAVTTVGERSNAIEGAMADLFRILATVEATDDIGQVMQGEANKIAARRSNEFIEVSIKVEDCYLTGISRPSQ